jgi:glycosyltransferase involved in cell wall biosynthesis
MKILLGSHFFHPSIGGVEEVSRILASEFVRAGHEVRVVTQTRESGAGDFPFSIYRQPTTSQLWRLVEWCEVFFQNNISLRTAWPLLWQGRPWVVAHHTRLVRLNGAVGLRDRLKMRLLRRARNIVVSAAVRERIRLPATIIGNPYRDDLFRLDPVSNRDRDLVYVGRLASEKGVDLLLQALGRLRARGPKPRLTIIGDGPEEPALRGLSRNLDLESQIEFGGWQTGPDLASALNRHRVLVVPSRVQETFGLVALEGMACGCVPLVAHCGGLPEAVGAAGVTFRHLDVEDLARGIERLLASGADLSGYHAAAQAHLTNHTAKAVSACYLRVLEEAVHL